MKKQALLMIAGGMLAFASCTTETTNTTASDAQIDSMVNARVEEIRMDMMRQNDSMINALAQIKADSMIAVMKSGGSVTTKSTTTRTTTVKPKPGGTTTGTTTTTKTPEGPQGASDRLKGMSDQKQQGASDRLKGMSDQKQKSPSERLKDQADKK